jgi:hypothetical protein
MSHKIIITDLFNNHNNISNESSFILIHSDSIDKLLNKLDNDDISSIYGYNIDIISNILKDHKLDPTSFNYLYHIYVSNNTLFPKSIVLANNNVSVQTNDFKLLKHYSNGTIWYPSSTNTHYPIGLI